MAVVRLLNSVLTKLVLLPPGKEEGRELIWTRPQLKNCFFQ